MFRITVTNFVIRKLKVLCIRCLLAWDASGTVAKTTHGTCKSLCDNALTFVTKLVFMLHFGKFWHNALVFSQMVVVSIETYL